MLIQRIEYYYLIGWASKLGMRNFARVQFTKIPHCYVIILGFSYIANQNKCNEFYCRKIPKNLKNLKINWIPSIFSELND